MFAHWRDKKTFNNKTNEKMQQLSNNYKQTVTFHILVLMIGSQVVTNINLWPVWFTHTMQ